MREAVGGSMLFYIVIAFLILYIVFVGFVMNYASAYRAANYAISRIESCNGNISGGCELDSVPVTKEQLEIDIKNKFAYTGGLILDCTNVGNIGMMYKAQLKISFDLPALEDLGWFYVQSESRTIYGTRCP